MDNFPRDVTGTVLTYSFSGDVEPSSVEVFLQDIDTGEDLGSFQANEVGSGVYFFTLPEEHCKFDRVLTANFVNVGGTPDRSYNTYNIYTPYATVTKIRSMVCEV